MRILYLCKRHYMGHDVIEDKYARLYEQPFQLASIGNDVLGVCLSYRPCTTKLEYHQTNNGSLQWIGLSAGKSRCNILFYPLKVLKLAESFRPDILVSSSDCLHIILGKWLSKQLNIPFSADLYDDYETFGLAKIPTVKRLFRSALNHASIISCVSRSLVSHINNQVKSNSTILSVPSTINREIFFPKNKRECRTLFGLPTDSPIVGTAGALTLEKGISTVYLAFEELASQRPDVHFVLAGPIDKTHPPPTHPRIHYLGILHHTRISELLSALDVGVIYLRNTQYGELSFPQKAYEMAACKIPIVAAEVGDMKYLFKRTQNELYRADDYKDLVNAITNQLDTPHINQIEIPNWHQQAIELDLIYKKLIYNLE